jgi:hypothetical protein
MGVWEYLINTSGVLLPRRAQGIGDQKHVI